MDRLEERLKFVRFWAKYVKSTDPKVWSSQQKELIDSILSSANQDVELYLKVKRIVSRGYSGEKP
ncbi:MAG: hypothetical protein ACP6IP_10675 [Candidatus Njordarchaeia archaeon]